MCTPKRFSISKCLLPRTLERCTLFSAVAVDTESELFVLVFYLSFGSMARAGFTIRINHYQRKAGPLPSPSFRFPFFFSPSFPFPSPYM